MTTIFCDHCQFWTSGMCEHEEGEKTQVYGETPVAPAVDIIKLTQERDEAVRSSAKIDKRNQFLLAKLKEYAGKFKTYELKMKDLEVRAVKSEAAGAVMRDALFVLVKDYLNNKDMATDISEIWENADLATNNECGIKFLHKFKALKKWVMDAYSLVESAATFHPEDDLPKHLLATALDFGLFKQ
jgi:hypothetical protein